MNIHNLILMVVWDQRVMEEVHSARYILMTQDGGNGLRESDTLNTIR